jgi:biotin carboxylase
MHVVYVVPFFMEATLRFVAGAAQLPGTRLSVVSQEPQSKIPAELAPRIQAHWQVADALDPEQILAVVAQLSKHVGKVERVIASLEQAQEPVALVNARLGLPGLSLHAARNFRDKSRMKDVLRDAGLPCARHRLVGSRDDALAFVRAAGFPVVVKPPAGAGAVNTFRLDDAQALDRYLASHRPDPSRPALFEEFLSGEEHSFDSICVGGRMLWWSVSRYLPSPLTVMQNPWIQWCVLLPRELDAYGDIRAAGAKALGVLGLETGMTHMEWFRRPDGSLAISEVAARPPGAQFTSLLSYAHDLDFYAAWPRLVVEQKFEAPARRWSVGAAYVRGQGSGRVKAIHGLDVAQRELGALVLEARLPRIGEVQKGGYEGAGYVILRHAETRVVEQALRRVVELVRVELA